MNERKTIERRLKKIARLRAALIDSERIPVRGRGSLREFIDYRKDPVNEGIIRALDSFNEEMYSLTKKLIATPTFWERIKKMFV